MLTQLISGEAEKPLDFGNVQGGDDKRFWIPARWEEGEGVPGAVVTMGAGLSTAARAIQSSHSQSENPDFFFTHFLRGFNCRQAAKNIKIRLRLGSFIACLRFGEAIRTQGRAFGRLR